MKTDNISNEENGNSAKHLLPAVYFLGVKVIRYRIVEDRFAGYECQKWRLWFPFWTQIGFTNTHCTIEDAIKYITTGKVVLSS